MQLSPTRTELSKFCSYRGEKGLMNPKPAYARSQAAVAVLSILDDHEKADLSKLDRESVFRRFVNKNGQRFTPESLQTYKQRFQSALDEFLAYAKDPSAYKAPTARERTRTHADSSSATSRATSRAPRQ